MTDAGVKLACGPPSAMLSPLAEGQLYDEYKHHTDKLHAGLSTTKAATATEDTPLTVSVKTPAAKRKRRGADSDGDSSSSIDYICNVRAAGLSLRFKKESNLQYD